MAYYQCTPINPAKDIYYVHTHYPHHLDERKDITVIEVKETPYVRASALFSQFTSGDDWDREKKEQVIQRMVKGDCLLHAVSTVFNSKKCYCANCMKGKG